MRLVKAFVMTLALLATATPAHAAGADLLPKLQPDRTDLADFDLHRSNGKVRLRFTGTVANVGKGGLHVVGKREGRDNTLTAFQQIEQSGGGIREVRIGKIVYHDAHNHYHLEGVSRYRLLDEGGKVVKNAPKVTFCLTDSEPVGDGLAPVYMQCSPSATADEVKMGISAGWKDIYGKELPGQSFDVTDLMKLPKQEYTLEMTSNPMGVLYEANRNHPAKATVKVKLGR